MARSRPPPEGDWLGELQEGARRLGVRLPPEAPALFACYMRELLRWQARASLTGFRTPGAIVRGGFLDSLACLRALPESPLRLVDIGSGAGFPGLPLALARPDLQVTLVEASRRRHSFLAHACRKLGLRNVRCLHGRAESLAPALRGRFDVALARAVRRREEAAALAAPFLRPGGLFVGQPEAMAGQGPPPPLSGFGPPAVCPVPTGVGPARAVLAYPRLADAAPGAGAARPPARDVSRET